MQISKTNQPNQTITFFIAIRRTIRAHCRQQHLQFLSPYAQVKLVVRICSPVTTEHVTCSPPSMTSTPPLFAHIYPIQILQMPCYFNLLDQPPTAPSSPSPASPFPNPTPLSKLRGEVLGRTCRRYGKIATKTGAKEWAACIAPN